MQPNGDSYRYKNRYSQLDQAGTLEAAPDPVTVPVQAPPLQQASSSQQAPTTNQYIAQGPRTLLHLNRWALIITGAVTMLVVMAGLVTLGLAGFKANNQGDTAAKQPASDYNVKDLAINDTVTDQLLTVTRATKLSINGELQVGNTFVLTPTATPSTPKAGQIYYDKDTNTPYVYNGSTFVSLTDGPRLESLNGVTGTLTLGAGLQLTGNQLALTTAAQQAIGVKVTTIQGQSGDVVLTAGSGISVNGTTITNTGVTQVMGGNGLVVTQSAGLATVTLPQLLGATDMPTFAGVNLSTPLGLASGGTNTNGSLYASSGVFYYDGSSFATTATPASNGLCLLSGPSGPAFGSCSGSASVTSLNGASGTLILDNATANLGTGHVTIDDASSTSKGIASFNASDFGVSAGVVSLAGAVTKAGNSFNGSAQLLKLDSAGQASSTGQCLLSTATGVAFASCPGGGNISNGTSQTSGKLTKFDSVTNQVTDSIATDTGTALSVGGALIATSLQGSGSGITNLTAANITGTISVTQGGTGQVSFAANSILLGNGTAGLGSLTPGANGDCLMIVSGAPAYSTCTGAGGVSSVNTGTGSLTLQGANGVTVSTAVSGVITITGPTISTGVASLNGLTGSLTVADATAAGNTVTINTATTGGQKGIASYDGTNFSIAGGVVNTIQGIGTAASPTFGGLSLQAANATLSGVGVGGTTALQFATQSGSVTKTIVIPNTSGTVAVAATGPLSLDVDGILSCPSCLTSGGGGAGGVSSLNTLTGALTIAGAGGITVGISGSTITVTAPTPAAGVSSVNGATGDLTVANSSTIGTTITINDATNATKGIASFASGDFSVASGAVSLGASVTKLGNTFNGAGQLVQLDASGFLPALNGSALTSLTAANISGTLSVVQGGTGAGSFTTNGVLYGNGTGAISATAAGTSGQCLVANTGLAPSFQTCTGAGGVSSLNTQTGAVTIQNGTGIGVSNGVGTITITNNGVTQLQGGTSGVAISGALTINNATSSGSAITIDDASSTAKGIASFASGDFSVASGAVSLGTVSVAKGGTGLGSYTSGDLLYASGSATIAKLSAVSAGSCLLSAGVGTAPVWGNCDSGAITGIGTYSTTNTDARGASVSGGQLIFQSASASAPGMVDTGTQTFAGNKTFTGDTTINGLATVKNSFQVQDAGSTGLLSVDSLAYTLTVGQANTTEVFTKLSDPAALPAGNANGVAYSSDGTYMAVAHATAPYVTIYKRSGDTFTKLANPANLPTATAYGVTFSPDGTYMTVAFDAAPYIIIYKRSGDTFTKLANPASLPSYTARGITWSPDGTYMSVAHFVSPYVTIYKRSGDTFTKLANPANLPTDYAYSVTFSPDGRYMVVGYSSAPFMIIYRHSGDTFTKLADPADLPSGTTRSIAFSPDGTYMTVGHSNGVIVYKRSGDTFTKLLSGAPFPVSGTVSGVSWSPDGRHMGISRAGSPFINIYSRSGDTFTALSDPATLPTGVGNGVAWSPDGQYITTAHNTSPYITIYKFGDGRVVNLAINGAVNGSTASFAGLNVSGNTNLQGSLLVGGAATASTLALQNTNGSADVQLSSGILRNATDSTAALSIQNSAGTETLFRADTTNNRIVIGNATGTGTATTTLVLDAATADPTGVVGAMYYNTTNNVFRCYTTGWFNCSGTGVSVVAGSGTDGKLAKFSGGNLADSGLSEAGTTLTYAGNTVVNATSGFTGNLLDLQLNGVSKLSVNQAGAITVSGSTLTGAGALTIGAGGTNQNLILQGSGTGLVQVSSNLNIQGSTTVTQSLTIGTASSQGSLVLHAGNSFTGTIQVATALGHNTVYVLPAVTGAIVEICTSAGNCVPNGNTAGDMLYWNGTGWALIPAGNTGDKLEFCAGVPVWGGVASVTTTAVSGITHSGATSGGTVVGSCSGITERGVVYATTANPTTANSKVVASLTGTSFTSSLTGLTAATTYYVRAYIITDIGTVYGSEVSFTTNPYSVGDTGPGGGTIFYDKGVYSSGWRYLEVSPVQQSNNAAWCSNTSTLLGATGTAIGSGKTNTDTAVATCSSGAIYIAKNYTGGGYTDWFLPSSGELQQLYSVYPDILSGMSTWSSSEANATQARYWAGGSNVLSTWSKSGTGLSVRAIRQF